MTTRKEELKAQIAKLQAELDALRKDDCPSIHPAWSCYVQMAADNYKYYLQLVDGTLAIPVSLSTYCANFASSMIAAQPKEINND